MNPLDQIQSMGGAISPAINEQYNPGVQSFGMSDTQVPSYGLFNWFKKKIMDDVLGFDPKPKPQNTFGPNLNFGRGGGFGGFISKNIFDQVRIPTPQPEPSPALPAPEAPAPAPAPPAQKTYRDFDWSDYDADRVTRDMDERDQYYNNYQKDRDFWGNYYNKQPSMPQPMQSSWLNKPRPSPYGTLDGRMNYYMGNRGRQMIPGPSRNFYPYEEQPNYGGYLNPDGSMGGGAHLMDFQDKDNDGYDDRYQQGPGHKPGTEYIPEGPQSPYTESQSPYPESREAMGGGFGGGFLGQLLNGLLGRIGQTIDQGAGSVSQAAPLGGLFSRAASQVPRKAFSGLGNLFRF